MGSLTFAPSVCEQRHTTQPRINLSFGSSLNLEPVANGGRSLSAVAGERGHDAEAPPARSCSDQAGHSRTTSTEISTRSSATAKVGRARAGRARNRAESIAVHTYIWDSRWTRRERIELSD